METNLLDRMLSTYLASRAPISITLQNKIRVSGTVKAFDSYVIVLEGQKREIVYRHAVSCITTAAPEEPKRPILAAKPAPSRVPARQPRPEHRPEHRPKPSQLQQVISTSSSDSINSSMKEGLLKWMQEQKAAK